MESQPPQQFGSRSAAIGLIIIIILGMLLWWLYPSKTKSTKTSTSDSAFQNIEQATKAPDVSVPTSANPIKQVLPKENPLEKTNPFKKTYVNPFE